MRPKKLSIPALAVLTDGVAVDGNSLRITQGQLDRKLYTEVNAALEALGGKWNRKAKAHLFDADPRDALDQVLVDGAFSDRKRDFDQFFTPPALARRIVELADVRGKSVLEPSAGEGAIALACGLAGAESVHAVEIDPKCTDKLNASLRAGGSLWYRHLTNFLGWCASRQQEFDRVVMNPPFYRQQDIVHVLAAYELWLKPGGKLVSVMSGGIAFRRDRKTMAFRGLIDDVGGHAEILPQGSFSDSGTEVNTVLVTLVKPV